MNASPLVTDLLKNVQRLNQAEFDDFFSRLIALRKTGLTSEISDRELNILREIEEGFPKEKQMKLDFLIARRDVNTLDPEQIPTLLQLTEEAETWDLKRLQLIGQLAELRGISLADAVELFDIGPVTHG